MKPGGDVGSLPLHNETRSAPRESTRSDDPLITLAAGGGGGGRAQRGSMMTLTVQTFAPNVYLLVLLALLDRLVLSPMITQRLGPKAARRDDR